MCFEFEKLTFNRFDIPGPLEVSTLKVPLTVGVAASVEMLTGSFEDVTSYFNIEELIRTPNIGKPRSWNKLLAC